MAKPRVMTAVPRSLELDLPKSCLYAPPLLLPLSRPPTPLRARARRFRAKREHLEGFEGLYLKANDMSWPLLFCMCHDFSASVSLGTLCMLGAASASRSRFRAKQTHKRV